MYRLVPKLSTLPIDKATEWLYDIGVTLAYRSSHQSQALGCINLLFIIVHYVI